MERIQGCGDLGCGEAPSGIGLHGVEDRKHVPRQSAFHICLAVLKRAKRRADHIAEKYEPEATSSSMVGA